jgi:hypothetical protein
MTLEKQNEIASSFSDKFEDFDLDITLSQDEFILFDKGVFSSSMDEKWNIFVLDNFMYWVRSWTNHCVFKIQLTRNADVVILEKGFVTRDRNQYNSDDIEQDKILFLKLLQVYLGRDDIFIDPAFQFDLVKQTLSHHQPISRYKKSIGRQSVKINKTIYQSLLHFGEDYVNKTGWTDFYKKIKDMNDDVDILSLYMHDKETNRGTTFHFDNDCKALISVILPVELSSR